MKLFAGKFYLYLIIASLAVACAKESSFESGKNSNGPSQGTLKDVLGNCQDIIIKGTYKVDTALTDSNYVYVQVNVTTPGRYTIYSDTANGFWFRDSGYTAAGQQTIKLKGYGKPNLLVNTDFIVTYNNSFCIFQVPLTSTTTPTVISDYFPTNIGCNWAYDLAGFADTLHIDATPTNTTYASNLYRMFIGQQQTDKDTAYYRKANGEYFQYSQLDGSSSAMEFPFLKDNQPVATQWETQTANTTFMGTPTQVKVHFTILAKNTTMTINNMQIDSIIKVQHDVQYKVLGNFQTISSGYNYYAKNIGLVLIDEPGVYTQTIKRWKIY